MAFKDLLFKKIDPDHGVFKKKEDLKEAEVGPPTEAILKLRTDAYEGEGTNAEMETAVGSEDPEAAKRQEYLRVVQNLSENLVKKRDLAVTARASSGIEQIWREDELAFEGFDAASYRSRMIDYATQNAPPKSGRNEPRRSKVVINIVRPKCETAEGRYSDIQLPTDNRNWGLKVTPVPELVKGLKDDEPAFDEKSPVDPKTGKKSPIMKDPKTGKVYFVHKARPGSAQATKGDVARSDSNAADEKMKLMEVEIDDQLTECEFNGECRKVIRNAVRLGTGVIKGPIVVKDLKKSWAPVTDGRGVTVRVLEMKEDFKPSSKSVDPWDVFPDPECRDNIRKAGYIWERESIQPRELRNLLNVEGYLNDQILEVLMEEPTRVAVAEEKDNHLLVRYDRSNRGSTFEKWEYNGDLDKSDLEALGIDTSDISEMKTSIGACVVMVNEHPIKVMLNPLDTGELPYDFFVWTERAGLPWGMGVARELAWPQRVLIAAWRAMMDNAGDSAGANIVVGGGIQPLDQYWTIGGKKIWLGDGDPKFDARKAFQQFQIMNNQKELQAIIELVLRFTDIESGLPMIFGGEKGELPETLGATNIMVDSTNVALRSRVKNWDDHITKRHIGRYYDYNMQYSKREEIKGDYKVDARGISILLERDMEAQDLKEILELRKDPEMSVMIDWEKTIDQIMTAKNLDVLLPKDKIEENLEKLRQQPPRSDPRIEAVKIRAEGDIETAKIDHSGDMKEIERKEAAAIRQMEHDERMQKMTLDIKVLEMSMKSKESVDKIKAKLAETGVKLKTQVALAKDKNVKPAEQVAEPVSEPAGRAAEGMAFQA